MRHLRHLDTLRAVLTDAGLVPGTTADLAQLIDAAGPALTEYVLAYVYDRQRWATGPRSLVQHCQDVAAACGLTLVVPDEPNDALARVLTSSNVSAVVDTKIKRAKLTT